MSNGYDRADVERNQVIKEFLAPFARLLRHVASITRRQNKALKTATIIERRQGNGTTRRVYETNKKQRDKKCQTC